MTAPPTAQDLPRPPAPQLPPELWNAHWFALFNAWSFQIVLGAPAILYAKSLGASATVLGVMTALTPLFVVLQIPAARHLPKYGYRRFTLAGWTARSMAIFVLVAVPWLTFVGEDGGVPPWIQLGLVLLALVAFNVLRGFVSGAWLPWLSEIIPTDLRAQFLARDSIFVSLGSLISLSLAALIMAGSETKPWQFSLVFAMSAATAIVSLRYIRRIPDVTAADTLKRSGTPVPWVHMAKWPPFARLVGFNLGWVAVIGGLGTFTVAYLRGPAAYADGTVLLLSAAAIVGALISLLLVGRAADRFGSVPVLRACVGVLVLVLLGWAAVASHALPASPLIVAALNLLSGVSTANFGVAMNRLTMATFPLMGRNHFFAMFSVVTNLGLGLSPILWGVLLDLIGPRRGQALGLEWDRYAAYFLAAGAVGLVTLAAGALIREAPRAGTGAGGGGATR